LVVSGGSAFGVVVSGLLALFPSISAGGVEVLEALFGVLKGSFSTLNLVLSAGQFNLEVGEYGVGVLEGDLEEFAGFLVSSNAGILSVSLKIQRV